MELGRRRTAERLGSSQRLGGQFQRLRRATLHRKALRDADVALELLGLVADLVVEITRLFQQLERLLVLPGAVGHPPDDVQPVRDGGLQPDRPPDAESLTAHPLGLVELTSVGEDLRDVGRDDRDGGHVAGPLPQRPACS